MIIPKHPVPYMLSILCGFLLILPVKAAEQRYEVDVCVYGATPAGITAAIAAKQEGASVILIEPGRWVGGMFGAGIKITQDCPEPRALGGLTGSKVLSFSRSKPPETPAELRENFKQWLADENIPVVYERRVVTVEKQGAILASARFEASPPNALGAPPAKTSAAARRFPARHGAFF